MLVLLLGFNSFGLPFFYWAKIQVCKLKAELAEREYEGPQTLTVFSSAKKGLQLVNSDELQVDGKMYDVVKTRTRNGVKYYYATNDKDEDTYIHKLADTEKGETGANSLPVKMLKLYEVKYIAAIEKYTPVNFSFQYTPRFGMMNAPFAYRAHFKDILSPPPDKFFS